MSRSGSFRRKGWGGTVLGLSPRPEDEPPLGQGELGPPLLLDLWRCDVSLGTRVGPLASLADGPEVLRHLFRGERGAGGPLGWCSIRKDRGAVATWRTSHPARLESLGPGLLMAAFSGPTRGAQHARKSKPLAMIAHIRAAATSSGTRGGSAAGARHGVRCRCWCSGRGPWQFHRQHEEQTPWVVDRAGTRRRRVLEPGPRSMARRCPRLRSCPVRNGGASRPARPTV